ncbi:MAG: FAD-dependent tricarballylate dehydrogenase TcuA [Alphaproteobacteria bacterium]
MRRDYDVIVVGAGNAALAAGVSARDAGAEKVVVLEKAALEHRGGNTFFSGGLFRVAFDDVEQLCRLAPEARDMPGFVEGVETYPADDFTADLLRVTEGRTDRELSNILIANSYETICWMNDLGIEMELALSLGGVRVGNVIKWPKGAIIRAKHEGIGLSTSWFRIAERCGVEILYQSGAVQLLQDNSGRVTGVRVKERAGFRDITGGAVILGCGGFEANMAWRAQYLGRPWAHAKVRGTMHNQGDGLRMAIEIGALQYGQWSGCHATPINAEAPPYGERKLTDKTNRLSYPYGVMINKLGLRFVDEGEDQQFYTYAKFGGIILNQPGSVIYQIFDSRVTDLLEQRYSTSEPITGDTIEELVGRLDLDRKRAVETLKEFNAAAGHGNFNPGELDGMCTKGIEPAKSNWAQKLDSPPFRAYPVTGGITFSFGGLKINQHAQVIATDWTPIPGLYSCGEMVGGIFHINYPGGTGLVSGAVFGRIAGTDAAREIRKDA